ncbi:MAG: hypothetical protein AAF799_21320 [Myxococcota bacterium]
MLLLAVGCSSAGEDEGAPFTSGGEAQDSPLDEPAGEVGGDEEGGGTGAADDGGSSDGAEPGDADDGGDVPPPPRPSDDDGSFAGCPQPLPGAWVFCEDFETIADPGEVMLDYQEFDGAFVLVDETGASGERSMQVTYREGEEAAGWMVLTFGASPLDHGDRPTYAPEGSFQEVYWRLRLKTELGWPDLGPGQLTRTISFADADWSEAAVAHLRSAEGDVVLEGEPATCIAGGQVACNGFDDAEGQEQLGPMLGETELFSAEESGRWHCVEGRLKLNSPGAADGLFEFWVDDELQASRGDLDLRGSWTEYGINALVVENLWPGGAPQNLRRWIDDVVVSTEPIGCQPGPAGATPN